MDVELARQIIAIETEMVQLGIVTVSPGVWPQIDLQASDAELILDARAALDCIKYEMQRLAPGDCTVTAMQWCQRTAAVLSRYAEQIAAEVDHA